MQMDFILFSISSCVTFLPVSLSFPSQMHCNKSMKFQPSELGRTLEYAGLLLILAIFFLKNHRKMCLFIIFLCLDVFSPIVTQ